MNLQPLTEPTKFCPTCTKRKVVSAFNIDKSKRDGRYYECRTCDNARRSSLLLKRSKKEGRKLHLFRGGNKCIRCGAKKRDRANMLKVGRFYSEYWVNEAWVLERPECAAQPTP